MDERYVRTAHIYVHTFYKDAPRNDAATHARMIGTG